jgi:hypothetical protein
MDARILLVTARLQRIEYRALLAMAVGVGGGGEGAVIELRKHMTQGRPARGPERAFAFQWPATLTILPLYPQAITTKWVHATEVGPLSFRGVRAWGREVDARREAGPSFS